MVFNSFGPACNSFFIVAWVARGSRVSSSSIPDTPAHSPNQFFRFSAISRAFLDQLSPSKTIFFWLYLALGMSFLKKYKNYLQDNPKEYWFKRKLYGWGWVPVKWQGWLATTAYMIFIIFISRIFSSEPTFAETFIFTAAIMFATFIFIGISYKKGEKPKWQWGGKKLKKRF